ncbi:hypothetical protein F3Y22_tig00110429pilonHSYRG00787 [Hibiscus syriacus]|uniref:Protein kinase domain-containing protein n=1 Tax=Hibiscus syriacus TaxID=106335 RepID=A0A6A3APR2_HIBSY|nr:hypothetical protein F3Y22_tig00110429pilonHSYRG00787 [Hibiscus syriacus]
MTEPSSTDVILDFLRRNRFTRAEAALLSEFGNRPDLNGFCQKLTLEEDFDKVLEEENGEEIAGESHGSEMGLKANGEMLLLLGFPNKPNEARVTSDKSFAFSNKPNGPDLLRNDSIFSSSSFPDMEKPDQLRYCMSEAPDIHKGNVKSGEEISFPVETKTSWLRNTSKANLDYKYDKLHTGETKELDQQFKTSSAYLKENFADNIRWSRTEEPSSSSSDIWKDCSVKTVFPFPKGDVSIINNAASASDKRGVKQKADVLDARAAIKEQVDEVGRALFFGKSQGIVEQKGMNGLVFPLPYDDQKEEFPRLPPVKLKSEEKSLNVSWEEKYEHDGPGAKLMTSNCTFLMGSYLDVPIGQEINASGPGGKRNAGGSWLSVSQGIAEDASDLVSGFATIGDGLSESVDYPNEYWDSDEYDDDDDVGYMRQPIEDEAWFLAHEIDYPSDNEKGAGYGSVQVPQERGQTKDEDDDQSFAEEDSYFSGERYLQAKNVEPLAASDDPIGLSVTEMYDRTHENDLIAQYDGRLMDDEELNVMRAEPVWQGFVTLTDELIMLGDGKVLNECGRSQLDDIRIDNDQHGSVRSIGVGISSDTADFGSEVHKSLVAGSNEGDLEYFHDHDGSIGGSRQSHHETERKYIDKSFRDKRKMGKNDSNKNVIGNDKGLNTQVKNLGDGGFSFPPPLRDGQRVQAGPDANAVRSANSSPSSLSKYGYGEQKQTKKLEDEKISGTREEDLGASLEDEEAAAIQEQVRQIKAQEEEFETFDLKILLSTAIEHRFAYISPLSLLSRTGFEEDKNFHVVLNSVIAGRYYVTEYLGSAAFSKAIQAHDLHTGMDACVKIIKNKKDFFDQSLDEIKLLKYVNKHDPADKHHILRLYDYFYYRVSECRRAHVQAGMFGYKCSVLLEKLEVWPMYDSVLCMNNDTCELSRIWLFSIFQEHLLIVCELLKANLYEFHKFNRESGGEVYFTISRLQSITIQCLEALQFLHGLGLIHCDLKPENILVKSYSRCEVKVIDFGSSCFETDHLCSYVQSRSYRAPEVILGLPYDKKIDIWSLGCILAELCTGNVLFQNDSPATLLARVIGIIGPIKQDMLAKGGDTYKYFTKNHMLYERNQETNRLEYLIPKKTSLRHRLPMGDQGFVDFVAHLLEVNSKKRPAAAEALKHPWLSYPYEPISA